MWQNFTIKVSDSNRKNHIIENMTQLKLVTGEGKEILIMVDGKQIKIDVLSDYQAIFSVMGNRVTIT